MNTYDRRHFLNQIFKGSLSFAALPFYAQYAHEFSAIENYVGADPTQDEKYWKRIRRLYTISKKNINLNNGGVSAQPKVVQEAVAYYNRLSNEMPSYNMWRVIEKEKPLVRKAIADLISCSDEELAILRNTTEAIETVIFGLQLEAGDEVVLSKQAYPHMKFAWRQRAQRDEIVLKWVDLKLPSTDNVYLRDQYIAQFTDRTKLVCVTQITNWNGQILPVKEIARLAKKKKIEVLVDAAHSVGQIELDLKDLDVDYLGSSLHKWLGAPFGSGILYVRKNKIKKLFPLFAAPKPLSNKIEKFEHLGTRSVAIERAILTALEFHHKIGTTLINARLQYLKKYIVERIIDIPGMMIQSPLNGEYGSGMVLFSIASIPDEKLTSRLWDEYSIHTTTISNEGLSGLRVSPNIYTQLPELDTFARVLKKIVLAN